MDVSVVILTYNSASVLSDCVESIFKNTKNITFEVIVVDSASPDETPEIIKSLAKKFPIKTKLLSENTGFTKGNNEGQKMTSGDYVLFLNPDTVLVENSLERVKLWMDSHTDVAVCSCQLLDSDKKISSNGGYFPTLTRVFAWAFFLDDLPFVASAIKSYHPYMGPWNSGKEIYEKEFFPDWVTGAFFFVRRTAMEKVGVFDENIFLYAEELEWCIRFKKAGWKVGYTPLTKIIHLERAASGGLPRNAILGEVRGLKYIYGKHFPIWQQLALGTILDIAAVFRIIFWLVRLKPQMAKIYAEALML